MEIYVKFSEEDMITNVKSCIINLASFTFVSTFKLLFMCIWGLYI